MRPQADDELHRRLLTPAEAERLEVHGRTEAAVLVAMFDWPQRPGLIFTERHGELRRHAGEISFPGGRRDRDESFIQCALREAQEEVMLNPGAVEIVGALPPVSTMVTSYKVHPIVGLVPSDLELTPNPAEVSEVLRLRLDDLVAGYGKRRLVRRGVPIKTDTYKVQERLVWGATARILGELLGRIREIGEAGAVER